MSDLKYKSAEELKILKAETGGLYYETKNYFKWANQSLRVD